MFVERGYIETTMAALAKAADVSVQTLYLAFGSKVDVLKVALDVSVVGDDEDVPLLDRSWVEEVRTDPDGPTALRLVVDEVARITANASPLFRVLQTASADAEVGELGRDSESRRLTSWRDLTDILTAKQGCNRGADPKRLPDLGFALISHDMHRILVTELGWTLEQWSGLAYETLSAQLFPDA